MFACKIPERNPQVTIKPPSGANSPNTEFRLKPIFVSINAAMKMVNVDKIADARSGIKDILFPRNIAEYIKNGIGMKINQ